MEKKISTIVSIAMILALVFVMTACGSGYDGTYKAVEISAYGQTVSAEDAGMDSYVLKISGDTVTLADGTNESTGTLTDDNGDLTMTFEENGETIEFTGSFNDDGQLELDVYGIMTVVFEKQ